MCPAAAVLLLVLTLNVKGALSRAVTPTGFHLLTPAGSCAFLSGGSGFSSGRHVAADSRRTTSLRRRAQPPAALNSLDSTFFPPSHTAHTGLCVHRSTSRVASSERSHADGLERHLEKAAWEQHLLGVWHLYLPSSVYDDFHAHLGSDRLKPVPLWIGEDGKVACPDLNYEGTVSPRLLSSRSCSSDSEVLVRLASTSLNGSELELEGILASSAAPTVSLWNEQVQLHAAVAVGAVFARPIQDTAGRSAASDLPENVEVRDSSGRVVLAGSMDDASHSAEQKHQEQATHTPKSWQYVGNFTAYRILGEDRNELRIRHPFLQFGPQRIYNIVDPDTQDVVHAFWRAAGGLTTCINGTQLRCDTPRGRTFDAIQKRLSQIVKEKVCCP
ncbi:transmembrane protein [Cyclospora cayetanensis]|uniref:Transmembrane protein n=1 Tax=Cyclospora cayetanensis TaxID=88456 RepID=A0A1D3D8R2_9EIME|nr:transmembrane protein [Cyclospora cayetanensis]